MGSITPARPGIMVVTPRLHDPTPENEEFFFRWTKLHDRDLYSLDGEEGKVHRTLRFGRDLATGEEGGSRLFYTVHTTNINVYKTPEYYAISRRLDVENMRPLHEGEVAVGCKEGLMVWDVVDARFSIYEELPLPLTSIAPSSNPARKIGSFQDLPAHLTSTLGAKPLSSLVGLSFAASLEKEKVERHVMDLLEFFVSRAPDVLSVYTSLYRHGGAEAQPEMHPTIVAEEVGGGGWLGLMLVVDEEGKTLRGDHVGMMVQKWVEGVGGKGEVGFAIWDGQMFMS